MATYEPPKRATEYIFYVSLEDQAAAGLFRANPTLATGDITISKDGGAFNNLSALPVVTPAGGRSVKVIVSDTEMTADNVVVLFSDAAGAEWFDKEVNLQTVATQFDDIASDVWDEVLTGATHNISTSAGKRLREIAPTTIHSGTCQAGSTANTIVLNAAASAVDGAYDPAGITIVDNTGIGQTRLIYEYDGATRTAVVDRNWKVTPDNTSEFIVFGHPGREHVNEGLAQGNGPSQITLNALASNDDNAYVGQLIFIRSGTGEDQVRIVTAYDGGTKVATVDHAWDVDPDATSGYAMLPDHIYLPSDILTTQMTEAYAADGVAPTLAQALLMIQQLLGDFSISGTTLTVKEIDGTTPAATYTLNHATNPTSLTRAT